MGRQLQKRECQRIIWPVYPCKLPENERNWTGGGGGDPLAPRLDPPMRLVLSGYLLTYTDGKMIQNKNTFC